MKKARVGKLNAWFDSQINLTVGQGTDELIFIELNDENRMVDAWYRHYVHHPEFNALCEQLIKDLFVKGAHMVEAVRRFNKRTDIDQPVLDNEALNFGGPLKRNPPYVLEEQFAAAV